jgi:predicted nucleotidyltransferase
MNIAKENNADLSSAKDFIKTLAERLKTENVYKIILFGSHAKGTANADSDIDLMIIVDDDFLPCNYSEKFEHDKNIYDLISIEDHKYGLDLIVYSRGELKQLEDDGNFFIDEIKQTGKIIYEKVWL